MITESDALRIAEAAVERYVARHQRQSPPQQTREIAMTISESEALAIAVRAAEIALAARPAPSCVTLTDAAEILCVSRATAKRMLIFAGILPNGTGKYRIEDVWRARGSLASRPQRRQRRE